MTWLDAYLTIGIFLGAGVGAFLIGNKEKIWKVILLSIVCVFVYPIPVVTVIWKALHGNASTQLQRRSDPLGRDTR